MTYSYGPNYINGLVSHHTPQIGFDFAKSNKSYQCVIGPDSYELLMTRCLHSSHHSLKIRTEAVLARMAYRVRREFNKSQSTKILVFGAADALYVNQVRSNLGRSPDAQFIPHPIEGHFLNDHRSSDENKEFDILISGSRGRFIAATYLRSLFLW